MIGAGGTIGKKVTAALKAHEVITVGSEHRGHYG